MLDSFIKYRSFNFYFVNFITFLRFLLSIYFSFLIFTEYKNLFVMWVIFLLIVLSDFVDGKIARGFGVESKFGSVFDVLVDFFFMFSSSIFLSIKGLFPIWLIVLVVLKLIEFIFTSRFLRKGGKNCFVFDRFGKFVANVIYVLPMLVFTLHILDFKVKNHIFYSIGIIVIVSGFLRMFCCLKKLKNTKYL